MALPLSKKSSRRQMQKEETRRIIMAAAYSLFGLRGYEKTTMRELAARADVSLGTIFNHFPDKPSLLLSAFSEDVETVIQNIFDTIPAADIKVQLTLIVIELYEFFGLNPAFSRTLIKEALFIEGDSGDMLADQISEFRIKIEKLFTGAIERGEVDHKINIRNETRAFLSYFLLGLFAGLGESAFDIKKQTALFVLLLERHLAGVLTKTL